MLKSVGTVTNVTKIHRAVLKLDVYILSINGTCFPFEMSAEFIFSKPQSML